MVTQQVHSFLIEPVRFNDRPGEKGADHEMEAGPVGAESAGGQPDQRDIPAVALAQPDHQAPEAVAEHGECCQEGNLLADPAPVHQDQRQHPPDGDVVDTCVAQDALTDWLAQDLELFHEQDQDRQRGDRAGHADAKHELPGQRSWADPALLEQQNGGGDTTKKQRGRERETGGNRALATVVPGLLEVDLDAGDHDEEHDCPPRDPVQ